ncbi:hypothetical protein M3J09_012100 [Ascochyta lentis]
MDPCTTGPIGSSLRDVSATKGLHIGLGLSIGQQESSLSEASLAERRKTCSRILDTIQEYALNKFDDSESRRAAGAARFLSTIDHFVAKSGCLEMCLPAFPFKSANKVYKVLGALPDKAEELALERLNTLCARIKAIYKPGARITIISDGITYNDLLSISDRDTWAYGETLRKMAREKKFNNLEFSRLSDLLDMPPSDKLREITFVANCTNFRRLLLNKYGDSDMDIDRHIANDLDTKLTYLGYRKFLESDLRHIFAPSKDLSRNGYKRDVKYLAKQMLLRGYAFAKAVKHAYPDHLRLSIHESCGEHKVSISLLDTKTAYTTPWHCSVALLANRQWVSAPMGDLRNDPRLELVYENGRPSYFKEKAHNLDTLRISPTSESYLKPRTLFSGTRSGYSSPSVASTDSGKSSPTKQSPATSFGQSPEVFCEPKAAEEPSGSSRMRGDNPAAYGQRLIPRIMDELASTDPERIVFTLATVSGTSLNFQNISAQKFAEAVDKTAWWLHDEVSMLGCTSASIQPVGYIGPHDLRHILLTYACVKVGYAALYLSPKNSTEGALAVLEATGCNIWVKATESAAVPLVTETMLERHMKLLELPLLEVLLDSKSTMSFPYTKTFEEAGSDPFCFLHTSGSTGVPKPIPWTHNLLGTMDAVRLLPSTEGDGGLEPWTSNWKPGDTIYSSFPMCHGAGIIMNILMPAFFGLRCVLGPPDIIPNIALTETLAETANIDIWSMVPSLVDELGEASGVLKKFQSSKFICASGGPVSPISAGKVNEVIRVLNLTGTTEGLFIGNLVVPREDWFWFAFHPYSGFEFKEIEPGIFEHWVHRNEHASLFQGIFHTFPEKHSINFKDLYIRHPTNPNLWSFVGRNDDLIVLSNGYKILPLETEAFISTHPAIKGCLVHGSNNKHPGLLIELKDLTAKSEELMDSIWETVEKANMKYLHTSQLLKEFIAFSDPKKPFIRTDKGTVKRQATLRLYSDFIKRFYDSRNNETQFTIDTTSVESILESVRNIIASSSAEIKLASPDDDLFSLGLDSIGVFSAIKSIRAAIKGIDQLAPRHLYANPTLRKFSHTLAQLLMEGRGAKENSLSEKVSEMQSMLARHRAHQSFRLNAFDYVNPNHYMGLVFYIPLQVGVSFADAFENLQEGLNRTMEMIPALGGKMVECSKDEIDYFKGELCVAVPPLSAPTRNRLVYRDLSYQLPSFEQLRLDGFVPSAFKDELVLRQDTFPQLPADVLVGQANFVEGGCILAVDLNHCCLDGVGAIIALKAWGENCRYLQGDKSATLDWYDAESFNHSLPDILHEMDGNQRPANEVDPDTWGFLPFVRLKLSTAHEPSIDELPSKRPLGQPPTYPLHPVWPLPPVERKLDTTLFLISPEKVQQLKEDVLADPGTKGVITSVSDIVQAFFWQSAIKARHQVAKELHKQKFMLDDMSILELPTDGRPFFSSSLPATYMGSMLILNRANMPVEVLCAPDTSIGQVALLLREAAARISPSVVHDAFTLLKSLPDYSRFSTANMGIGHMHAMISNMMLFQTSEISFGDALFANGGSPLTMRPQLERGSGRFRFLCIFPMKEDGGIELALGTYPEEREMMQRDEVFTKYAQLVDVDTIIDH